MTSGQLLTLWTVRIACILYLLAVTAFLNRKHESARLIWSIAFLVYFSHVLAAFSYYHDWSHDAAYQETARQTAELFGIRWGEGLYFNYAFTAVWAADILWIWLDATGHRRRPAWITVLVHAFLAFMFFNAAVVFGKGWVRWIGAIATAGLGLFWLLVRCPRRDRP